MIGTAAVLIILSAFRFIELRLPSEFYAHHALKFDRQSVMPEDELRRLVGTYGFTIANMSSRLIESGKMFEYRMVIRTRDRSNAERLTRHLLTLPQVIEFRITPTGD
jgi:putative Mg2+ transporter-C (MgtC) family protein